MNEELEAMIKKALSDEPATDNQAKEKESVLTDEEREALYRDDDGEYQEPWQRIHNR